MTSISTKKGDNGTTTLIGSPRMSKSELVFDCLGTVDELSSHLGLVIAILKKEKISVNLAKELITIQRNLFIIGAELAGAKKKFVKQKLTRLEEQANLLQQELQETWLSEFVLPGGSIVGAELDISRTVTRRLERLLVKMNSKQTVNAVILQYINRLSDYLFIARYRVNQELKEKIQNVYSV